MSTFDNDSARRSRRQRFHPRAPSAVERRERTLDRMERGARRRYLDAMRAAESWEA